MMRRRETRRERIAWVDAFKGIGIISVVLGHVFKGNIQVEITPATLSFQNFGMNLVYSFHMPLFFMLSGYAYFVFLKKRADSRRAIIDAQLNLALLYFIYNVLLSLLKVVFAGFVNNPMRITDLARSVFLPTTPMWYLYILLFYYPLFLAFPDSGDRKLWLTVFCVAGTGARYLLERFNVPSCIVRFFYYLQFFWLGGSIDAFFPKEGLRDGRRRTTSRVLTLLSVISIAVNWTLLYKGINSIIANTLCAYGVICLLLVLRERGCRLFSWKPLLYAGEKSLCIFLLHTYVVTANRYMYRQTHLMPVSLEIAVGLMAGILVPLALDALIERVSPKLHRMLFQPGKLIAASRAGKKAINL